MPDKPTPEQIAKLPRWAQEHIKYLARERAEALDALNSKLDVQTPSKIYWEEYMNTGEAKAGPSSKRFYAQTNNIIVENCGVRLEVACYDGVSNSMHHPSIELKWEDMFGHGNQIACIPTVFQQVTLIAWHNMKLTPIHPKLCLAHGGHNLQGGHCLDCGISEKEAKEDGSKQQVL